MPFDKPVSTLICLTAGAAAVLFGHATAVGHDGPDPVMHWRFDRDSFDGDRLVARIGPDLTASGGTYFAADSPTDDVRAGLLQFHRSVRLTTAKKTTAGEFLPAARLTVSGWIRPQKPERWGGIVGQIQDDGDTERGWLLGYEGDHFSFAVSSKGADDGDGKLTYMKAEHAWHPGSWHHVAATYDGKLMVLYVNGKEAARSAEQSGDILNAESSEFVVGAYSDANEFYPFIGQLADLQIFDEVASAEWVQQEFEHRQQLTLRPPVTSAGQFVVDPYLQFGTTDGMTVMWMTNKPGSSVVQYGETAECEMTAEAHPVEGRPELHQCRLSGLRAGTQYFYSVRTVSQNTELTESDVETFTTAVDAETPFAFAVMGDTQGNPEVSGAIAAAAWGQRPHFVLHVGDLVSTGRNAKHWTEHFFPGMRPLINRVPFYPVLGNHEQNAQHYFDYVDLPQPEYYYSFEYGNAEFFMIDSNRNVAPDSEQFLWLDEALGKSDAVWKIVCHHHPPYSSDENDYGDLWKTNQSTRGDQRIRALVPLYDRHQVDIVWNGHIHSYERTWPLNAGKATDPAGPSSGTTYMITGGAGGGLESPGPFRPWFQNNVRHGHHYCMVMVNGRTMELKAFDQEGRLFDTVTLRSRNAP